MATINLTTNHSDTVILNVGDILNVPGGVSLTTTGDAVEGKGNNTINLAPGGTIASSGGYGIVTGSASGLGGNVDGFDLVNNQGGVIQGSSTAVYLDSQTGIVLNSGSINSDDNYAVYIDATDFGGVDNSNLISGYSTAVYIDATNAAVTNESTGIINSANGYGVYLDVDGGAFVANQGQIHSYDTGVYVDAYSQVTVLNTGSIVVADSTDYGVYIDTYGDVRVQNLLASSAIQTHGTGVYVSSDSNILLTNAGTIASTDDDGVYLSTYGSVHVENAGVIDGGDGDGVEISAYGNVLVNNTGTIHGGGETAVYISTYGDVTVNNTASITSDTYVGVYITTDANVSMFNSGTIRNLSDDYGVEVETDGSYTLLNTLNGQIKGEDTALYISAYAGSNITNLGTIDSTADYGIYDYYGRTNLFNSGQITALDSTGVYIDDGGNQIANSGLIKGFNGTGVYIDGDANNILNTGAIVGLGVDQYGVGSEDGIHIDGSGNQIVNAGPNAVIFGSEIGVAIHQGGSGDISTLINTGNIAGGITGIDGGSGREFITNNGWIGGGTHAADLGSGTDVFDNSFGVVVGANTAGVYDVLMGSGNDTFFGGHTHFSADGGTDTGVNNNSMFDGPTAYPAVVPGELGYTQGPGDTISFAKVGGPGFIINLLGGSVSDGTVVDQIQNFENATGSSANDIVTGDTNINVLDGGPGGADTIIGGGAPASSVGSIYNSGGPTAGQPGVAGEPTADIVTGDIVSYNSNKSGVIIDLAAQATFDGVSHDALSGIESAIGSTFNDIIWGNNDSNTLRGGAGDDVLRGFGGADAFYYKEYNFGHDTVQEFDINQGDVLAFDAQLFQPTSLGYASLDATHVLVSWDGADNIVVTNSSGITVADVQNHTVFV